MEQIGLRPILPDANPGVEPQRSKTAPRRRKWRWLALGLLGLTCLVLLLLHWYLHSRLAANQLEARLSGLLSTHIQIDSVAIGYRDTSVLTGLTIDAAANGQEASLPLLTVKETTADLAALGWLAGRHEPHQIDLNEADIQLRFDAAGHLVSKLPLPKGSGTWPRIRLTASRIRIEQEGVPAKLELTGLEGEMVYAEPNLVLTGVVHDPQRGDWEIAGSINPDTKTAHLKLSTPATHLTGEQLKQLPFVSPRVWNQVQIEQTETSVELILDFALDRSGVGYRLTLNPNVKGLHVASINLNIEQAAGRIVVDNSHVVLDQLHGHAAGGEITTSGDLDFRSATSRMKFDIGVKGLDLRSLPPTWRLPPQAVGHLTGTAQLEVDVNQGQVQLRGGGKGTIPLVKGVQLPVRLYAEENHLHFGVQFPKPTPAPRQQK